MTNQPTSTPPSVPLATGSLAEFGSLDLPQPEPLLAPLQPAPIDAEQAFKRIVKEYSGSLYYFVFRRVGHPDDAADITQQAFVEAACGLSRFRGEAELSTWIFGIALNLCRNHINRAPQRRHAFESEEVLAGFEAPFANPEGQVRQRQALSLTDQAMKSLSPDMARALHMVAVEDMSYEEVAEILDVPVGTVRSRVSRARAQLRRQLDDLGVAEGV